MSNQPSNQPVKKLTLKRELIHLLTTLPSAHAGPTAIDCSVTC